VLFSRKPLDLPAPETALSGRDTPIEVPARHFVLGTPLTPPFPEGFERIVVGMGCFCRADAPF
jgi:peptide-methionine (S)-S-oxide reductase